MFQVSSELYDEIAIRLREAFGGGGFYSGSVECAVGGDLVQVDGVARSLPQRRPLAEGVADGLRTWFPCGGNSTP